MAAQDVEARLQRRQAMASSVPQMVATGARTSASARASSSVAAKRGCERALHVLDLQMNSKRVDVARSANIKTSRFCR
jgi:hypothetical protein